MLIEKDEILPFEEAKLYGHNAIHALLAYLGWLKGYKGMSELRDDKKIMSIARDAFLDESGAALLKKYSHLQDELFTIDGFRKYADDLLVRMTNPYLADTTERAGRDPVRKLAFDDRIFGTMTLALDYKIEPQNMALAAVGGLAFLLDKAEENNVPGHLRFEDWQNMSKDDFKNLLNWIWGQGQELYGAELVQYVHRAAKLLREREFLA